MANKVGRPTKYKPQMCETILELMKEGASLDEVRGELDISKDTLYRWKEDNEDFSDSIKRGIRMSQAWWEKQGRISLRDRDFNYTGWYMNMKNRFKWSDKKEFNNEGSITVMVDTGISRSPGQDDDNAWLEEQE